MSRPPTREDHCPACNGKGSRVVFDVEVMKRTRSARGITQAALARAANWQASVVSELESGARPMTQAAAERYWRALLSLPPQVPPEPQMGRWGTR
jgi:hypothetical protein